MSIDIEMKNVILGNPENPLENIDVVKKKIICYKKK